MQITVNTLHDTGSDIQLAIQLLQKIYDEKYGSSPQFGLPFMPPTPAPPIAPTEAMLEAIVKSAPTQAAALQPTVTVPPPPGEPASVPAAPTGSVIIDEAHHTLPVRLPDTPSLAIDADTDSAGQKWDAAIHSETRSKVADGTWRKRRTAKGVVSTPALLDASIESVPVVPMPPAPEPDFVAPAVPPPPAAIVPPPPFVTANTFQHLMTVVTQLMAAQRINSKVIGDVCREHGIASLQDCFTNTALIPSVHVAIERAAQAGV